MDMRLCSVLLCVESCCAYVSMKSPKCVYLYHYVFMYVHVQLCVPVQCTVCALVNSLGSERTLKTIPSVNVCALSVYGLGTYE